MVEEKQNQTVVTQGTETTEYKEAQSAKTWGIVATVLGLVITFGSTIAEACGADTRIGIIAGAVVTAAGIAHKTFVQLGYIKSRTDVKTAAIVKQVFTDK